MTDALTGKPIQGVPVTDGYSYAVTDYGGRYVLQGNSNSRTVYLSVPAEYEIPTDADHHPAYYKNGNFGDISQTYINDFQLTPRSSADDDFVLAAAADIHIYDNSDLTKFTGRSLPDLVTSLNSYCDDDYKECVVLLPGDQLSDKSGMMAPFKAALAGKTVDGRKLTFLHCIGNHDFDAQLLLDNALEKNSYNASATFVEHFGPTDYSLNIGKAHIVVMNNMMVKGTGTTRNGEANCIEFDNGFTDEQLAWLKADLALVERPDDKVVILCVHVPIFNRTSKNFQAVAQLLTGFHEAHVISGHTHRIKNYKHGKLCAGGSPIYEHNLQMMGGMWWKTNLSVDGSPAGFGLMKFSGKKLYESVNKATGEDLAYQLRVYDGNTKYTATTPGHGAPWYADRHRNTDFEWAPKTGETTNGVNLKGKFIARVWNADDDNWTVEFVQNGVSTPMTRMKDQPDQCTYAFSYIFHDNIYGNEATYHAPTGNIWVIDAPSGTPASETGWKVVATHRASDSRTLTYERNVLQSDFTGFAYGASVPANK